MLLTPARRRDLYELTSQVRGSRRSRILFPAGCLVNSGRDDICIGHHNVRRGVTSPPRRRLSCAPATPVSVQKSSLQALGVSRPRTNQPSVVLHPQSPFDISPSYHRFPWRICSRRRRTSPSLRCCSSSRDTFFFVSSKPAAGRGVADLRLALGSTRRLLLLLRCRSEPQLRLALRMPQSEASSGPSCSPLGWLSEDTQPNTP